MTDQSVTIVEVSIGPLEAADRADAVLQWLQESGVVVPNEDRVEGWQPSAYVPGPVVRAAAPDWQDTDYTLANSGVDVLVERQLYHPLAGYRPARCPACGQRLAEDFHDSLAASWLEDREPDVRCPRCGAVHPLGDWPDSYLVGELAVSFHNWPPLAEEFVAKLGATMGPRARVVYEQY